MASIGTVMKIPTGTTVKRQDGTVLKVGDTVAEREELKVENPSPDFTIEWSPAPPPLSSQRT